MITDDQLYSLAVFLGAAAMLLIVLYHFLEVNAQDDTELSSGLASDKSGVGAVKPVESQTQTQTFHSQVVVDEKR
ncbi:hypothetical protein HRR83_009568 [Exophiala dermatitidis]|uniref:Dolichyl-diphosphooligosaccharide--protein glycosyltransferase subunit 4 n=2 Tax=Exophiala dermatitidis TaxID=5970 RepID=H6BLP8_EXODN|nr:uncharacterized protein HMPREF1120_01093 [Exophiala dermatitidis NIH/UT8656]KAJ4501905.1 hypothetical protein HRR75_008825 [Exophiala dermatitidis]EHY52887.1 hypothetical protein HMPREF1120_01093 [Exophiala dermatitidis NIH/UT8656]KAJ4502359.1 hypothetical protein HRR74_009587 [Exophiala dermatitidis]KAJ4502858.1 hypothetical protein HRR73_009286 [Exophiala dermatitidis]KAJ4530294.1 hypothetical protein HRR77_009559 [Exophiala dermatitidis]